MSPDHYYVQPLGEEKYYGTNVLYAGGVVGMIWINDGRPSARQFAAWDITEAQWDNNALVDDGNGGLELARRLPADCHYESQSSWLIASAMAAMANSTIEPISITSKPDARKRGNP